MAQLVPPGAEGQGWVPSSRLSVVTGWASAPWLIDLAPYSPSVSVARGGVTGVCSVCDTLERVREACVRRGHE